jgi:hypothetical protein
MKYGGYTDGGALSGPEYWTCSHGGTGTFKVSADQVKDFTLAAIDVAFITTALGYTPLDAADLDGALIVTLLGFIPVNPADVDAAFITTALGFTPVDVAGDTMTGPLVLDDDPANPLEAATKQYVDAQVGGVGTYSDEQARDAIGTALVAGSNITITVNDGANTITFDFGLTIDTDGTLAANSDSVLATQKAVKTAIAAAVTGLWDDKGAIDCSANPNYPAASKGDSYTVSVAGKIGGASGVTVDIGDLVVASADNAGGTQAAVGASWNIYEHNLIAAITAAIASTTEQLTGTDATKLATPDSVAALWEQGSDVASSGTISLGEGGYFFVTGTTGITDIDFATDKAGRTAWVKFSGALTLTHNASTLILPGGANITTEAGDTACFISEGSDAVRCVAYQRASGRSLDRNPSIQSVASSATVTPTFTNDQVNITAQAAALALANPTGTAVDASGISIRIKDNGTPRAITFDTQYRAIGVTLPTTTVANKTLYLGIIFNAADTKWDVVAVAQEA